MGFEITAQLYICSLNLVQSFSGGDVLRDTQYVRDKETVCVNMEDDLCLTCLINILVTDWTQKSAVFITKSPTLSAGCCRVAFGTFFGELF